MEKNNTRSAKRWTTTDVTRMALVTGLYVAVTLVLSVFSFGVIQIRSRRCSTICPCITKDTSSR